MNDNETDFGTTLNRVNGFIQAFKDQHEGLDHIARDFDADDVNRSNPRDLLISDLESLSSRAQVAPVKELVEQLRTLGIISPGTLLHMPGDFRTEDVQQITELLAKVAPRLLNK